MAADTKKVIAYKLAQGFTDKKMGDYSYVWDYTIHYLPDSERGFLCIGEGGGREGYSIYLDGPDALQPQWRNNFLMAQGEWLLPLLERLSPGQKPATGAILEAYQKTHGVLPPAEEWDR